MATESKNSIGRQVAAGATWTIAMRLLVRGLGLISTLILARLLLPHDFGIIAKAALIYELLDLATSMGLQSALISNQAAARSHYDTAWTIHVLRGLLLATLLGALSVPVAGFFNEPDLVYVVPAFALMTLLDGATNVGTVDFLRHFRFDLDFRYVLHKRLAGFIVTVVAAWFWRSYWAFVAGMLAGSLAGLVSSFLLSRYRPRFTLAEWRSLFHFAKFMLPAEVVGAVATRIDGFILGRFESTATFGVYSVANQVATVPSTEFAMPVGRALMPGLATLQHDAAAFRTLFVDALAVVLAMTIPAALGLAAVSEPLVPVVLGTNWTSAAPMLGALALAGVARSIGSLATAALLSRGLSRIHFQLRFVVLATRATFLGIGYLWGGVIGLCWGLVLATAVVVSTNLAVQAQLGMVDLRQLVRLVHRTVIGSAVMWLVVTLLVQKLPDSIGDVGRLGTGVAAGLATYLAVTFGLWLLEGRPPGPERRLIDLLARRRSPGGQDDTAQR